MRKRIESQAQLSLKPLYYEEQLLLIRYSSGGTIDCEQEIVFALPNLPDDSAINNPVSDFNCDSCCTIIVTINESSTISYRLTHEESECVFNYEFTLQLFEQKDLFLPRVSARMKMVVMIFGRCLLLAE